MMWTTFLSAFRRLRRQPLVTAINVIGLAVGMASCMLISLYVTDELSFDRFHKDADRVFRIVSENSVVTPGTLAPICESDLPGGESVTRLYTGKLWGRSVLVTAGSKSFYVDDFYLADPSLFDVFSFPLTNGATDRPLTRPNSAVLSKPVAQRLFGHEDPIGRTVTIDGRYSFTVDGVLENIPSASHLRFDMIAPFDFYRTWRDSPNGPEQWYNHAFATYVKLLAGMDVAMAQDQFNKEVKRAAGENYDWTYRFQPLTDIHLYSHLKRELSANGNVGYVYLFSFLALLILGIAAANFVNLSTARAMRRAGDVGIRKILGASRVRLLLHFIAESVVLSIVACAIAYLVAESFIPELNAITGKQIASGELLSGNWLIFLPVLVVAFGALTGLYPAWYLSRFEPVSALKGDATGSPHSGVRLRRTLVVAQFSVAIALIVCTLIVQDQLSFVQKTDLGFSGEQILTIPTRRNEDADHALDALKERVLSYSGVLSASSSSQTPGRGLFRRTILTPGAAKDKPILSLWADHDFLKTYRIQLLAGRDFNAERSSDATQAFILNETAAAYLGFPAPDSSVGQQVSVGDKSGSVIGVVEDFHFMSLHSAIEPVVIHIDPSRYSYLSVRLAGYDIPSAIAYVGAAWKEMLPGRPFEYFFVDEDFGRQYAAEQRLSAVFRIFSALAVIVASLGLLGLAAFITGQRTKEIGIRKVLGATTPRVMVHIGKEFVLLSLLANILAWPAAYLAMNSWLVTFAYRTNPGLWVFVVSGLVVTLVALTTVAFVTRRAASANPVESLRYE